MKIADVARIAYEAVRTYAMTIGDNHHRKWSRLDEKHQQSLIGGALFHFVNPQIGPEAAHLMRCKKLMDKGWAFGLDKDEEKKLTPILVAWDNLPPDRQMKYFIFCVVAGNLAQYVEDGPEPPQMAAVTDPLSEAVGADTALISSGSANASTGEKSESQTSEATSDLPSDTEATSETQSPTSSSDQNGGETSPDTEQHSSVTESASTLATSTDDRQAGVGGAVTDEPVTPEEIDEAEKDAKQPDAA